MFLDGTTLDKSNELIHHMEKLLSSLFLEHHSQEAGRTKIAEYNDLAGEFELNDFANYFAKNFAARAQRVDMCKKKLGFEAPLSPVTAKPRRAKKPLPIAKKPAKVHKAKQTPVKKMTSFKPSMRMPLSKKQATCKKVKKPKKKRTPKRLPTCASLAKLARRRL